MTKLRHVLLAGGVLVALRLGPPALRVLLGHQRARPGALRGGAVGPVPCATPPSWKYPVREIADSQPKEEPTVGAPGETALYEHFQMGRELLDSGNPAQAAVRLEKAREAAPGKASVRETLGRAYFELARFREAEREFRAVVQIDPSNDYAHFCLSRALQRRGRFQQAEAHLKLAQAMSPDEERYRRWSDS